MTKFFLNLSRKLVFPWSLIIFFLFVISDSDTPAINQIDRLVAANHFSVSSWVFINTPVKFLSEARHSISTPSREDQNSRSYIVDYFELSALIHSIERDLSSSIGPLSQKKHRRSLDIQHLELLITTRSTLQGKVQTSLQQLLSSIVYEQGLYREIGPFDLIFPPVYFQFGEIPKLLVISPRDKIVTSGTELLSGGIPLEAIQQLEQTINEIENHSSLVVDIAGLATYPSLLPYHLPVRQTLRTIAHEWMHQFWFFTPFGRNYFTSPEMTTLNETAAELIGNILGDLAYELLNINPKLPIITHQPNPNFNFNEMMRETRTEVETMIDKGHIDEAEAYMEKRRQIFVDNGYFIRKLNQAFFAFHGTYAESPTSSSPLGNQLRVLWQSNPDVRSFVDVLSPMSNVENFQAYVRQAIEDTGK